MQAMMDFYTWIGSQLPSWLFTEPLSYFTAFAVAACLISLLRRLIHL